VIESRSSCAGVRSVVRAENRPSSGVAGTSSEFWLTSPRQSAVSATTPETFERPTGPSSSPGSSGSAPRTGPNHWRERQPAAGDTRLQRAFGEGIASYTTSMSQYGVDPGISYRF
jgi:hypothetical protein